MNGLPPHKKPDKPDTTSPDTENGAEASEGTLEKPDGGQNEHEKSDIGSTAENQTKQIVMLTMSGMSGLLPGKGQPTRAQITTRIRTRKMESEMSEYLKMKTERRVLKTRQQSTLV